MTAPYLADAEEFLASPAQEHIVRATLSHPSYGTISVPIPSSSTAVVTFDENSAPRVTAGLSVPLVDGVDDVDARTGWRLELEAGYKRPDGVEDVNPLCDLGVRKTPRRRAPGLLEVSAVSDEALVIDAAPAVAETLSAASPAAAVTALLGKAISPAPYVQDNLTATGAVSISPLEDRWSALGDLGDRYGAQIYDDGLRTWHALPQPSTPAEVPVLTLRAGEGGTVVDLDEDVDRDAWFNYVLLRYRWRTSAGADAQIVATAYVPAGPYSITGPAGKRIFRDDREVATTQAEANAAARAVLTRTLSRAETMTVRAVAAYWLRPGHTVDVVRLDGTPARVIVSRVAFDLVDGSMTVQTRLPAATDEAATSTPPPDPATPTTPKPATPDPTPPAKSAYVTEWPASSTATYRGNGTKRTDVAAGDLWQGMFSGSYNGNQKGLALFTAANSQAVAGKRSETGKTVSQALTGDVDVTRVEVVATVEHTWANPPAGADIRIGYYDGTSAPASGLSPRPYVASNDWTKGTSRTVNVTSSGLVRDLLDGSARGITFGPGASTSTAYYARISNIRIRIHYSK